MVQVKNVSAMRSIEIYAQTLPSHPEVIFDPPGGPVAKITPRISSAELVEGKYHVATTVGCSSEYLNWQILV